MIKDIHVSNFRLFADFEMSDLARVNLIAGKNNVGKSTLLDALYLLFKQGEFLAFLELIHRRKEFAVFADAHNVAYDVNHLFSGRRPQRGNKIFVSANDGEQFFNMNFLENNPDRAFQRFEVSPYEIEVHYGRGSTRRFPLDDYGILNMDRINIVSRPLDVSNPSLYITTEGIDMAQLSTMWDKIGLSVEREYVLRMLNILDPDLSEIQFLTSRQGVRVKHRLFDKPIPLGSMGDGMSRILGIAMSMATLENGYLIVDEIDTGLHYRTITDMWKLVITAAKELNIQVFATTHSQDCLISFSEAMRELEDNESGAYFRLQRRGEKIHAERYNADDLADALESGVEVR